MSQCRGCHRDSGRDSEMEIRCPPARVGTPALSLCMCIGLKLDRGSVADRGWSRRKTDRTNQGGQSTMRDAVAGEGAVLRWEKERALMSSASSARAATSTTLRIRVQPTEYRPATDSSRTF